LPPPTFVTLTKLAPLGCAADALASFRRGPMETFEPRLTRSTTAPSRSTPAMSATRTVRSTGPAHATGSG
jgi:hypothetical protein